MGQTEASRQADFITPPVAGQITVLVTGAAASQDLRACGVTLGHNDGPTEVTGLVGGYASFFADGAAVGVIFGPTLASVTGANAPVIATTGVNAVGACFKIPDQQLLSVKLRPNVDNFIGFVGAAAGLLRIVQSSTKP